ncbi:MAG: hypothetical protein KH407_09830, partial [Streptococcus sp.]|nr:hypothetical protein [Streptococcus sp.]
YCFALRHRSVLSSALPAAPPAYLAAGSPIVLPVTPLSTHLAKTLPNRFGIATIADKNVSVKRVGKIVTTIV